MLPGYIILPCYNEDPLVVDRLLREIVGAGYRVLVVDDGSGPPLVVSAGGVAVEVIRHPCNLGQGAALATGLEVARRRGAAWCVTMDADGQHDPAEIAAVLRPVLAGEADIVFGSRFLDREAVRAIPAGRRWLLRWARLFNSLFTGLWMSDAHNGFRALNARALAAVRLRENGMAHATEILWQVKRAGLRWCEVATHVRYSAYSRAKGQPGGHALRIAWRVVLRKVFP